MHLPDILQSIEDGIVRRWAEATAPEKSREHTEAKRLTAVGTAAAVVVVIASFDVAVAARSLGRGRGSWS